MLCLLERTYKIVFLIDMENLSKLFKLLILFDQKMNHQTNLSCFGTKMYLGICLDSSLSGSYMRDFLCCHQATEWSPV